MTVFVPFSLFFQPMDDIVQKPGKGLSEVTSKLRQKVNTLLRVEIILILSQYKQQSIVQLFYSFEE